MNSKIFKKNFTVPSSAIDAQGHVNNLAYLQWCIEIAEAHWKEKASKELQQKYAWYVLHHSIDYKSAAFEGNKLEIETWVSNAEGAKSERCYSISRVNDGKILVVAKTLWCFLDAHTQKPTKIPEEIRNLFV